MASEEVLLLILGTAYLAGVGIYALRLMRQAEAMLRTVRDNVRAELWQELGAPKSVKQALNDPERRWIKFLRSGDFRLRCPPHVVVVIDTYRRRTNWMLIAATVTGLLILFRFWPLLKPSYL